MKNWLVIGFLFLSAYSMAFTGKISGNLTFKDGRPASYAVIGIQKLQSYAFSDDKGYYELTEIPYGDYLLEVNTIEAEAVAIPVKVDAPEINLAITLKENSNLNLNDVTVWGKNTGRQLKDQGFAMGVVETGKASLQSYQTTDLLDRTAGIRIRQSGGMGSEMQFNINGLTGNSIRIFIDGIPVRNYGGSFSISSIPPAMIERIEIYKGVVPAHLSEDALGGAINIILKNSIKNNLATSYSFGSFNTHQWNMNGHYRDNKTGFTVNGSAFYNYTDNSYKVWGDQVYVVENPESGVIKEVKAKRFHDSYRSMGLNADVGFTSLKWADIFSIGAIISGMDKDIQHGATMEVVYGNRRSEITTRMFNMKYEKQDLIKNLSVNLFASYSYAVRTVTDTIPEMYGWNGQVIRYKDGGPYLWGKGGGEAGAATNAQNTEKMFAGRGNIRYAVYRQHIVSINYLFNRFTRDVDDPYWIQLERELSDTRYLTKAIMGLSYDASIIDNRLKSSLFYKYYMQQVKLKDFKIENKQTVADIHYRTTHNSGFGAAFSFRLIPKILLLLSGENALRLPESNEMLGNTSENIESSYDLKPEQSTNLNIGFNLGVFEYKAHWAGVDINFFYRDIRNMITRRVTNTSTADMTAYENLGKVRSQGVDIEFRYGYKDKLNLTSNLSNFNARFNQRYDEAGNEYGYYKKRLRNAPYFTWNNMIEYSFYNLLQRGSQIKTSYYFNYVHEFFRNWDIYGQAGKAKIPTQAIHDFGLTYTFPGQKISLSFDIRNFTNEQVFDNWALQKPGRAFYGKISYRIY